MSLGDRFGFDDCGETPNVQIALWDYQPAPMICEVRNLSVAKQENPLGKFRNRDTGVVIDCEGGYFAGDAPGGAVFDRQGKKVRDFQVPADGGDLGTKHVANFVDAVRSRKAGHLVAEALEGHLSATCCHLANISYRLGRQTPTGAIRETIQANGQQRDAIERCIEYLRNNGVDLEATPAVLGPWLTFDPKRERFTGQFADQANALLRRACRAPFVVPEIS
jgi:hypothetical protein